ncbi:MAG: DUF1292 domain-containing protein [Oscillospiraceae bacterium]|nr:DUF1292 domain-containing protein [Oscillospiraceae bacterium]
MYNNKVGAVRRKKSRAGKDSGDMAENNDAFLDEEEGIIELEDEEGNVTRFEFVDRAEYNGVVYYALIPADYDENGEGAAEFVVLKEQEIDGDVMLATVDDDDEYNAVGEMFLKRFSELPDLDDGEEEE